MMSMVSPKLGTEGLAAPGSGGGHGEPVVLIEPVNVPKASDVLAANLRERILSGELAEGTALPPERDLVTQTQLSRATVREALRILEIQGLLRIRPGRTGGAFVQRPDGRSVASSIELLVRGGRVRLAALHETREAIEPFCASLAARSRAPDDLAELDAATADMETDDLTAFLVGNVRWHVAVARASHNDLLAAFMQAISRAIFEATDVRDFVDEKVRATAIRAHRSITEAITQHDADAAQRRMLRHVHGFAEAVELTDRRREVDVAAPDA